ncbi:hypothetical protein [Anaerosporobacter sp.]|uniref:hypothetical protein n=1 Tax=Anaerosporobacter sp. TaxID=1872529 RepID=UPI00286F90DA|nr:hypothetical protein [Anaerosporobacter sp.]
MFKKITILSFITICCVSFAGCGKNTTKDKTSTETIVSEVENTENANKSGTDVESYSMSTYTEAPNEKSSIKIEYPSFVGNNVDALNTLVYDKVQSLAKIDTSLFSSDSALTIDYQSAVTLQNSKIVSIIFWGTSNIEGSAYPVTNLFALNIDLQSMKEVTLKELYTINDEFEKVFFEKAYFPTNPITSYDEASFPEMLKLQSSEYQTVDPFSIDNNVSFFLKPDGIVLSMPATHATGSDHIEAELNYSDIQQFYQLKQNYWQE